MAVHVPLSRGAIHEARNVMLSTHNMLSPSSGEPLVAPTYEIVLGCYYLTQVRPGAKGEGKRFSSFDDAMVAFDAGLLELHSEVMCATKRPGRAGYRQPPDASSSMRCCPLGFATMAW